MRDNSTATRIRQELAEGPMTASECTAITGLDPKKVSNTLLDLQRKGDVVIFGTLGKTTGFNCKAQPIYMLKGNRGDYAQ